MVWLFGRLCLLHIPFSIGVAELQRRHKNRRIDWRTLVLSRMRIKPSRVSI